MKTKLLFLAYLLFFFQNLFSQPKSFSTRGIGGGGALFFPTINPANNDEFYVSCDLSALFHSTDYGKSYDQVDFQKIQSANTTTYEFTNDPNTAFASFNDGNNVFPIKTNDGGQSWKTINSYDLNEYGDLYNMKANFNNPLQMLIGAYGDILITNDGGNSFQLVKHTINNGAGLIMGGVFWDGNKIYIGTNEGIIVSLDGGVSFNVMPNTGLAPNQILWSFAGAKENGTTRFVCIAGGTGDVYNGLMPYDYYDFAKGVYTMDNASGTWVNASNNIDFSRDYVMYVAMAANDVSNIYLGGNDNSTDGPLVLKSTDGGLSWNKKFNTNNNQNISTAWEGFNGDKNWSWSETCFGISCALNDSKRVMFGNYSNVQLSNDGADNWRQAYVNEADSHPANAVTPKNAAYHSIGLENTSCWQVFWQDANTMMGCYSDIGGIRSTDAGQSWGFQYTGMSVNSLYRMVKGADGTMYGGCSNIHDIYQSTRLQDSKLDASDANGKIVFSKDNGATWSNLKVFNHPVYWLAGCPNNPNLYYASVIHYGGTQGAQQGGIYSTYEVNNLSNSLWMKLPNPPRTEGHPGKIEVLKNGKVLCSFSGRRNPNGVFTPSSGIFVFTPLFQTWEDLSDPGMYYWTKDFTIDPNDSSQNTWYVCVFSGWGGAPNGLGGLYKTINGGKNWTKLTSTKFDRVSSLSFNPKNGNEAYLTTETQGLWVSKDMDQAIPSWTLVDSYPFRQPERVFFNPYNPKEMWVSSFGNGMRVGTLNTTDVAQFSSESPNVEIFPNPSTGNFTLKLTEDFDIKNTIVEIVDLNGKILKSYSPKYKQLQVNIKDLPKGTYVCKIYESGDLVASNLLFVQ